LSTFESNVIELASNMQLTNRKLTYALKLGTFVKNNNIYIDNLLKCAYLHIYYLRFCIFKYFK